MCSAAVFVKKSSLKEGAQQLNVNSLSNCSEWMPCIYYMTHISGLSPTKDLETAFKKISNKYSSYYEAVLMVIFLINTPLASSFGDWLLSNTHSKISSFVYSRIWSENWQILEAVFKYNVNVMQSPISLI